MVQHQPLLQWILLLDINTPMLNNNRQRDGGITGMSEVTVMGGYLRERDVLVDPFASTMVLLLGSTG